MPRQARIKGESGIYHIMLRGINGQAIFEDDDDKNKFLETIEKYKAVSGYKIFAYCLMSNHIHLLLKTEKEDLNLIIKRIAGSYVYWYNWKYKRTGHLFQDRYKSEPVDDDAYFLTVIRYIHQNPVKAGMCGKTEKYKYSSYDEYINNPKLVDTNFCLNIIDREQFIEFNNQSNDDTCLEIEQKVFRMTDDEAKLIVKKISKCNSSSEFLCLPAEEKNRCIKKLSEEGLSIRQISRLTGVNINVVRKYI